MEHIFSRSVITPPKKKAQEHLAGLLHDKKVTIPKTTFKKF